MVVDSADLVFALRYRENFLVTFISLELIHCMFLWRFPESWLLFLRLLLFLGTFHGKTILFLTSRANFPESWTLLSLFPMRLTARPAIFYKG